MLMEGIIAVFGFILTLTSTLIISYFKRMSMDLSSMSQNMVEMNVKLEKVINDQVWHKEEINDIKERLYAVEKKVCKENR